MPERLVRPRPQVLGRVQLGEVELLEGRVQGEGREREVDVHEHDEDRQVVVDEQRRRLVDEPDAHEELVQRPRLAQDRLPGVDPEQVARPERDDDREEHDALPAPAHVAHEEVRERQGDGQPGQGHGRPHEQGLEERPDVRGLVEEPGVVVGVQLADQVEVGVGPPEAEQQHDEHGDDEEQDAA